ncbi:MAG: glycosyltransferase, partial [Deltaproteobacteria bacterium]|nr:glycosyltransferase [Deltaproteobacteria bacterium]
MPTGFPFFSVITATRNAGATLPRLLESLASQTCRDFELIIQDGASTDDTLAIVEAWRERLPALSPASGPDMGVSDAWNRALPRIRGQW